MLKKKKEKIFGGKFILKEKFLSFIFKRSLGCKNPMIFKKRNIPFRDFAHPKYFFIVYIFLKRNSNMVKRRHFV